MPNPLGSQALYKGVQQEVVTKLPLEKTTMMMTMKQP